MEDEQVFSTFKSPSNLEIYRVFFIFWEDVAIMQSAISCVASRSSRLLALLPSLAEADCSFGSPVTHRFVVPSAVTWDLLGVELEIQSSVLVPRYLLELSEIEHLFRGRLDGLRILEIGGGYGGMAATVAAAANVSRYSIVDLDIVGTFITKYLDRIGVSRSRLPLHLIKENNKDAVESDLLYSFFCFSEQKGAIVEGFIKNYVAHAKRGLVQLNYDDDEAMGKSSKWEENNGWSVLQIFSAIYKVQPTAVLLPPARCEGYHYNMKRGDYDETSGHFRIRWGSDIAPRSRSP